MCHTCKQSVSAEMRRNQNSGLEPINPALGRQPKATAPRTLRTNLSTRGTHWEMCRRLTVRRTRCSALPAGTKDQGQDGFHAKGSRLLVLEARGPNSGCRQGQILRRFVRGSWPQGPWLARGAALPAAFAGPWPADASPRSLPPRSRVCRCPDCPFFCMASPLSSRTSFSLTKSVCGNTAVFKIVLPNAYRIM